MTLASVTPGPMEEQVTAPASGSRRFCRCDLPNQTADGGFAQAACMDGVLDGLSSAMLWKNLASGTCRGKVLRKQGRAWDWCE